MIPDKQIFSLALTEKYTTNDTAVTTVTVTTVITVTTATSKNKAAKEWNRYKKKEWKNDYFPVRDMICIQSIYYLIEGCHHLPEHTFGPLYMTVEHFNQNIPK